MDDSPGTSSSPSQSPERRPGPASKSGAQRSWFARWKTLLLMLGVIAALAALLIHRWSLDRKLANKPNPRRGEEAVDNTIRDPYSFGPFTMRPSETDRIEAGIKPGHWTMAGLEVRANFDDFHGDLATEMIGPNGELVELDGSPFRLRTVRPAVLAKMQKKVLEIPTFSSVEGFSRQAASRLLSPTGADLWSARELLVPLPADQYFCVVLAQRPTDYQFLHHLDCIRTPRGSLDDRGLQAHYRLLTPLLTTTVPLPDYSLFWTSTAVILWDGIDPSLLSATQQQAMSDWLHWGGQLIVSGPESLDQLRGSFLQALLPANAGETWQLSQESLEPLSTISPDVARPLTVAEPWTGRRLAAVTETNSLVVAGDRTSPLIVERRVGRGRVVVTAFSLAQRDLVEWSGYDAVFNAALLRRPSRRFVCSSEQEVGVQWADGVVTAPSRVSDVRYFTRDAGRPAEQPPRQPAAAQDGDSEFANHFGFASGTFPVDPEGQFVRASVAGWDDQSAASQQARDLLREAAGIDVPTSSFVVGLLAAYVVMLVPLNWLVFRSLGRVEWAWFAAPLVAAAFGALVIRLAQLNVGFDRSVTEVSVVELQGGYDRGHVTRYLELYTSLSTDYVLDIANANAVALPFAMSRMPVLSQHHGTVELRQDFGSEAAHDAPVRLSQFHVASNSVGMVHIEECLDLGGSLQLLALEPEGNYQVVNGTNFDLHDVQVAQDERVVALGTLAPGATAHVNLDAGAASGETPKPRPLGDGAASAMDLTALVELARKDALPGEVRLIGWTEEVLPGVTISPSSTRNKTVTLFVAHLRYAPFGPLAMDFNSRAEIKLAIEEQRQRAVTDEDSLAPAVEGKVDGDVAPQDEAPR